MKTEKIKPKVRIRNITMSFRYMWLFISDCITMEEITRYNLVVVCTVYLYCIDSLISRASDLHDLRHDYMLKSRKHKIMAQMFIRLQRCTNILSYIYINIYVD